jgi:pyrroloquinoline-quinone synthase
MSSLILKIHQPLLNHPWYQSWTDGAISHSAIKTYAREYYHHVSHFPRYLSRLHSETEDLEVRRVILENLRDEENWEAPHPELWLDFAEALGAPRSEVRSYLPGSAVRALVAQFQACMAAGPVEGLGAILAYETQIPGVAHFKLGTLRKHYLPLPTQSKGLRFFEVHAEADVWHAQALSTLVEGLSAEEQIRAQRSADLAGMALWRFLDSLPN